jgi:hypothetical protein
MGESTFKKKESVCWKVLWQVEGWHGWDVKDGQPAWNGG